MKSDDLRKNPLPAIINKLSETIYWMDKTGKMLGCNDLQAKLFGLNSAEELQGKNIFDVAKLLNWSDDIPKKIREHDLKVMETREKQIMEETVILDNKTRLFLAIKEPWLDEQEDVLGVIGIGIDITERKKAEVEAAKNEFIRNMEHDLRTPFSGIYGFAQILYERATDPIQKEYLSYILTSSEQWMKVVDQILSISSIEKDVFTLVHFDIKEVVNEVYKFLKAKIKLKKLNLTIECASKVIFSDRLRIHRILLNLLGNAVQFTETGQIHLTVSISQNLEIIIEDTGCGIPEDKLDIIFDKYTKLSPSNKYGDKFQGSGLGLYISKQYITELQGKIIVESKLNKGSKFTVFIPNVSEGKNLDDINCL